MKGKSSNNIDGEFRNVSNIGYLIPTSQLSKNFNFDINKYEKFKNKIIYLKIDKEPEGLKYFIKNGEKSETKEDVTNQIIKLKQ